MKSGKSVSPVVAVVVIVVVVALVAVFYVKGANPSQSGAPKTLTAADMGSFSSTPASQVKPSQPNNPYAAGIARPGGQGGGVVTPNK